jgi:hypothetical protein
VILRGFLEEGSHPNGSLSVLGQKKVVRLKAVRLLGGRLKSRVEMSIVDGPQEDTA